MSTYLTNFGASQIPELVLIDNTTDLNVTGGAGSTALSKEYTIDASKMVNRNYLRLQISGLCRNLSGGANAELNYKIEIKPTGGVYVTYKDTSLYSRFCSGETYGTTTVSYCYAPTAGEFTAGMTVKITLTAFNGGGCSSSFANNSISGWMIKTG